MLELKEKETFTEKLPEGVTWQSLLAEKQKLKSDYMTVANSDVLKAIHNLDEAAHNLKSVEQEV